MSSGDAPHGGSPNPIGIRLLSTQKSETSSESNAAQLVEPTVRTNFADTALWAGSLTTDDNGAAQVSLIMPENLTTWKVRVLGHGAWH